MSALEPRSWQSRKARILALAIWDALYDRHVGLIAAGVAFYATFAIFPGMAATISIWGFFADPVMVESYINNLQGIIPVEAAKLLADQLHSLIAAHGTGWRWTAVLPLALATYSVHNAVAALISGLTAVQGAPQRTRVMRIVGSTAMTIALLVLILAALAIVVAVPILMKLLALGPAEALVLRILPWAVLFTMVKLLLGFFYRFGPSGKDGRHNWVTTGSVVAAFLWALVSIAFSLYLENFGSYNRIYGSIGAVIALMMWLYLSAYIVLFGAVVNAELARLKRAFQ